MALLVATILLTTSVGMFDALDFGVIDAHVHIVSMTNKIDYLWAKDPSKLDPPRSCPCSPPCACNWTIADYKATSESSFAVDKVVFCEVDANPNQWLDEVKWVQNIAEQQHKAKTSPAVGAIVAHPPPLFGLAPPNQYKEKMDELQQYSYVTGLRPSGLNGSALQIDALKDAGKRGLVIDLNMDVHLAAQIAQQCPETEFVIEHMGGANVTGKDSQNFEKWQAGLKAASNLQNVKCIMLGGMMSRWASIGAVNSSAISLYVKEAIREFGYERVCFEGNWFFNNWGPPHPNLEMYSTWASMLMAIFKDLQATDKDIQLALRENSLNIYKIK